MRKLTNRSMESRAQELIEWHGFSRNKALRMVKKDYIEGRDHLYEKEVPTDAKLFVINNLVQLDLF